MTKPLRDLMPITAAWIDQLREAFGADAAEVVVAQIRAAVRDGLPTFHATEAGHSVGVPLPPWRGTEIRAADMVLIGRPPEKDAHGHR